MEFAREQILEELSVEDIVVISGVRPCGRTVNMRSCGRPSHGLLYIWEGEATFELEHGKTLKVTNGQLLYIPKMLRYKMQYTRDRTVFVVVNFRLHNSDDEQIFLHKDATVVARDDAANTIANIMTKLEQCSAAQNLAGYLRRKELLYRLLAGVICDDSAAPALRADSQIAKGVLLLKQTYLENLPIEFFAQQCNVSISTFRQHFQKHYAMSPLQYRNLLRINRAKQILEEGGCTVAEAAYASGFENVGYFCRYYKKVTGETPKQTKLGKKENG